MGRALLITSIWVAGLIWSGGDTRAQLVGGHVAAGTATISQPTSTSTLIQQLSPRAIIDWTGFSIPKGSSVTFQQPSASAIALNRVLGGVSSALIGPLNANGQVWIINPAGIVVGSGANISAAGLLLSTVDIHDVDFLAGNYSFDIPGSLGAGIINQGNITAASGGSVVLAGQQVANEGVIAAKLGTIILAGAQTYTVDFVGDGLLSFAITGPVNAVPPGTSALVENGGTLSAEGGLVMLTAQAAKGVLDNVINTSGIIEATTAEAVEGKIVLSAEGGGIELIGTLDASGSVDITGPLGVAPSTSIETTGSILPTSAIDVTDAGEVTIVGATITVTDKSGQTETIAVPPPRASPSDGASIARNAAQTVAASMHDPIPTWVGGVTLTANLPPLLTILPPPLVFGVNQGSGPDLDTIGGRAIVPRPATNGL